MCETIKFEKNLFMLKEILSIAGKPGLYKLISSSNNALIVESLLDGKRFPAYASSKIIALEDIAIYTDSEDKPLREVFRAISEKENGGKTISHKESGAKLKKYMSEILPEYDEDRVYVSDMKKLFQWYNLLHDKNLLSFDEGENAENTED